MQEVFKYMCIKLIVTQKVSAYTFPSYPLPMTLKAIQKNNDSNILKHIVSLSIFLYIFIHVYIGKSKLYVDDQQSDNETPF